MKFPHRVFYTDNLPNGVAGRANGPFIRIRKSNRKDAGLIAHEYEHVRQWYITLGLHPLLYRFSRRYRLWSEARAFAEQADTSGNLAQMARRLAGPRYDLDVTPIEARRAIQKHL